MGRGRIGSSAGAPFRRRLALRTWGRVVAAGMLVVLAACGDTGGSTGRFVPRTPGVLTVATAVVPAPGFWEGTFRAPTGGFEYGLAVDLARRLGLRRVRVVEVPFGDLTSGHLGTADLALSQLTPTDQRERVLDFSTPYLESPPGVLVRTGTNVEDVQGLQRLRWVVVATSTLTDVVRDVIRPEATPLVVDTRSAALHTIQGRRADAMLLDLPVALGIAEESTGYAVAAQLPGPEGLAVALPNGSDNLLAVDSAIRGLQANGTIDDLSARWLETSGNGMTDVPLIRTDEP